MNAFFRCHAFAWIFVSVAFSTIAFGHVQNIITSPSKSLSEEAYSLLLMYRFTIDKDINFWTTWHSSNTRIRIELEGLLLEEGLTKSDLAGVKRRSQDIGWESRLSQYEKLLGPLESGFNRHTSLAGGPKYSELIRIVQKNKSRVVPTDEIFGVELADRIESEPTWTVLKWYFEIHYWRMHNRLYPSHRVTDVSKMRVDVANAYSRTVEDPAIDSRAKGFIDDFAKVSAGLPIGDFACRTLIGF